MLLFKEKHIEPILNGTKTETRRIWKRQRVKVGSIHQCRTQMLNKDSCFAKVRILDVWSERLGDIDTISARKEGYTDRYEYLKSFAEINSKKLVGFVRLEDLEVFVITFEVVKNGQ